MGQWVLTMRTTGDGGFVFFHKDSGGDWEISLHPAIDYFITSSVSLGATCRLLVTRPRRPGRRCSTSARAPAST